jgi:hypothetical protein
VTVAKAAKPDAAIAASLKEIGCPLPSPSPTSTEAPPSVGALLAAPRPCAPARPGPRRSTASGRGAACCAPALRPGPAPRLGPARGGPPRAERSKPRSYADHVDAGATWAPPDGPLHGPWQRNNGV